MHRLTRVEVTRERPGRDPASSPKRVEGSVRRRAASRLLGTRHGSPAGWESSERGRGGPMRIGSKALSARNTLENFFGGITLFAEKPIEVGHFCRMGDHLAVVESIGLRPVKLRSIERTVVMIPNAVRQSVPRSSRHPQVGAETGRATSKKRRGDSDCPRVSR